MPFASLAVSPQFADGAARDKAPGLPRQLRDGSYLGIVRPKVVNRLFQ